MRTPTPLLPLALVAALVVPASAETSDAAYPAIVGDSVGPANGAHWPVRVRALDRIDWTYRGGKMPGMVTPLPGGELRLMAGAGHLRALEPGTGEHTWVANSNAQHWNYSSCVVDREGNAYFGNHTYLTSVDKDGERRWRTPLAASWIHRPPALSPDGRSLYLVSDTIGLVSLDAKTGHVNWLRRDWTAPWACITFDAEGRVLLGTGHTVTCFDGRGAKLWQLRNGMRDLMVVGNHLIGTASAKGEVRCVDLRTRKFVWRRTIGRNITGTAIGDDGRIRVTHASGSMTCLDQRGNVRWTTRVSEHALMRPSTALGGDALTVDQAGTLHLVDRSGHVTDSIATGKAPYRWRPAVGPDGAVYVTQGDQVVRIGGAERPLPDEPLASELVIVADDFVVDVWVNGKKLPDDRREMLAEVHGAMTERISVDLDPGDWIVFHVVANRFRWGGSSYFGAHATTPLDRPAFSSSTRGNWFACDDVTQVHAFITERDTGADRLAVAPRKPWQDADRIWRTQLGHAFPGDAIWGRAASTWIKCIVPKEPTTVAEAREAGPSDPPLPEPNDGRYRGPAPGTPVPGFREPSEPPPPPPPEER